MSGYYITMPPVGKHDCKFDTFMMKYPHTGSKRITHTRIPERDTGHRGGAYHVPQEHMEEFWSKYHQKVFESEANEYLTERQHQQGPAPLLVDIDMLVKQLLSCQLFPVQNTLPFQTLIHVLVVQHKQYVGACCKALE